MKKNAFFRIFSFAIITSLFIFNISCSDDDEVGDPNGNNGNGNGETSNPLVGSWIGAFDEPILGPGEIDCNSMYLEFSDSDFKLLSFIESDPASGIKATYNFDEEEIEIFISQIWANNDWHYAPDTALVEYSLSNNDKVMNFVNPDNDEIDYTVYKNTPEVPEVIVGKWGFYYEGDLFATINIEESGNFVWAEEQSDDEQSGTLFDAGEINGDSYIISHVTYCLFQDDGDTDYYTMNKYNVSEDGDELTIWHGDQEMILERM